METVPVCLIEKNALYVEGLKSLFANTPFRVTTTYADMRAATQIPPNGGKNSSCSLLICSVSDINEDTIKCIRSLRQTSSKCRIAILAPMAAPQTIIACLEAGADGYIARDVVPETLLSSLKMIMAGEKVYPGFILAALLEKGPTAIVRKDGHDLSNREVEILERLAIGETNKQIARKHNIAEATVKVHVKTILRKLSLSNRTQAAIWALDQGVARPMAHGNGSFLQVVNEARP